ncbi:signal recognition particle protein [Candidatus Pacearchaeota archaeon]|nr:MAG: signal recognition particle protein [Candidatus Pacearchaeota archaeon]
MVLEKIGNALKSGIKKISNAVFLDKRLIDNVVKEIQRALIEADVDVNLVLELSNKIKKIAYDENIRGVDKKEQLIKLIHDEIMILIGEKKEMRIPKKARIVFLGLYGSGKTTTVAKLGFYFSKRGKKVALLGLDTQRPAAMDQLEQMAKKAKIKVFADKSEKDPIKIIEKFEKELEKYDLVLVDTAGRDGLNKELISEIKKIESKVKPSMRILVLPADVGQAAKKQSLEFQKALSIDGVIITRMDGTSKAGGALTACAQTKAPVYFIGTGEQLHEIESFNPKSFIQRLLGMGDLHSLIERVRSATDASQQKRIEKRLKEGKFTLIDLYSQLEQMNKLGSIDKLLSMIPGISQAKLPKDVLENQEKKMKKWKAAISSMTEEEIENPELLEKQTSRIQRIAKGSGTTTTQIRELLKQYHLLKEMLQMQNLSEGEINQKTLQKIAKRFRSKIKL